MNVETYSGSMSKQLRIKVKLKQFLKELHHTQGKRRTPERKKGVLVVRACYPPRNDDNGRSCPPTPMSNSELTGLWSLVFRAMWLW